MPTSGSVVVVVAGRVVVVVTSLVVVSQGESVLEGCKLQINLATNAANLTPCANTAGGRVRGVFTPSQN